MRFPTFAARQESARALAGIVADSICRLADDRDDRWYMREHTAALVAAAGAIIGAAAQSGTARPLPLGPEREKCETARRELLQRAVAGMQRAMEL